MQQDVNAFLTKITGKLRKNILAPLIEDFSPTADPSWYSDDGKAAQNLVQEVNDGRTLKQKNYFSLFNPKHREEALMLFKVFINCKEWDPCVRNNAAYFRARMNEGVFVYAVYVGVIHHPLSRGVVLPPLYEVTPHMFTNTEVINQAYTAQMTQTPGKFNMGYTGSQKNPEQRVAYFGEDLGMNVHHVSWHMDYPFWWEDSFGYNIDRKGELFFWAHHQLTARFDAERLSNNMNMVDELYWDRPIYEGFAPHTTYKYGGEFPARPDNINFEDVEGVARMRDLMIWEDRIRDAIAHGYVTSSDGTSIDILNDKGIDILGDLIESSTYSVNKYYYGALHNTAHIVLGRQGDPKNKFKQPPGVMEHFETATRDPAFFRLHKYMNNIFKEFKDRLPPYSKEDLLSEGIDLQKIEYEGTLETYFEDFEFSLVNAVDDSENVKEVPLTASVKRLNHKPFQWRMTVENSKGAATVASARIYMCPRRDANGVLYHPNSGRWGCIEMDKFYVEYVAHEQQDVNAFLTKITGKLRTNLMAPLVEDFSPTADHSMYSDDGKAAHRLLQEVNDGRTLKQHNYFSLFNTKHREEALMLFEVLMDCKSWDPCFRNNAAYFRERMNEGVFTYALYVAVIHHPIAHDVVLPPLYEVTPHMFTNSEVINKAYTAKMTQTPGKFNMGYTGSQKNPEQRVAYFGEDLGMNVHHVTWHMDFPFWWEDKYGYSLDRKGELFFWAHHQLTARFDAERLSNNMNNVDELYWDRPIYEGFAPHTSYKYGGEFPARPDNIKFEDVDGVARIRDLMIWEDRIRDAIAHGYVTAEDGHSIDILNDRGIDILGNLIESSTYSVNSYYYGSLHNTAHMVLGRQGDPHGKFNLPPGVMEHFETATRDPAFFRLHKYMNNIFKEFKDRLSPYTKEDFLCEGIDLQSIEVEGSLETYFEDFEFSLANAVDDTEEVEDVSLTATVKRLNHKPFSWKMQVENSKDAAIVASVRISMCPRRDANGLAYHPNSGRWGCIEMDKFYAELAPGANTILRDSKMSSVTIPDIPSFDFIKEKTDAAIAAGSESSGLENFARSCGIPDRLYLPKGKENGLEMVLMAFLEDAEHDKVEGFVIDVNNEFGGTHAHCGIHGQKIPDTRALGYPLDRPITDFKMTAAIPNFKTSLIKVYHKPSE